MTWKDPCGIKPHAIVSFRFSFVLGGQGLASITAVCGDASVVEGGSPIAPPSPSAHRPTRLPAFPSLASMRSRCSGASDTAARRCVPTPVTSFEKSPPSAFESPHQRRWTSRVLSRTARLQMLQKTPLRGNIP